MENELEMEDKELAVLQEQPSKLLFSRNLFPISSPAPNPWAYMCSHTHAHVHKRSIAQNQATGLFCDLQVWDHLVNRSH